VYAQTKGVRAVVTIENAQGAWMSAVGAVGASIVGTLVMWPVMKRYLRKYDEKVQNKDAANGGHVVIEAGRSQYEDVEEDR
jgi:hypothetical protein